MSVSGYMSIASPTDGSFAYLMSEPFGSYPTDNFEGGKFTDMLVIRPSAGTSITYTEKCVRVTGTIAEDSEPVNWCLTDISYEVISPNVYVEEYNSAVDSGKLSNVDEWLNELYTSTGEVSSAEYEAKTLGLGSMKEMIEALTEMTKAHNEKDDEKLQEAYASLQSSMGDWLSLLEMKGNE